MSKQYGDLEIENAQISEFEKWDNPEKGVPYLIHLEHPEFTALCPRSGYPDFGTIIVDYYPDQWVVELKSFKLYINSFRNERISHERVINVVADKIFTEIAPRSLRVVGDFKRRGNVKTIITTWRGARAYFD